MLVRFSTAAYGPNLNVAPGDVAELEDAEALRFIDAGLAEPVDLEPAEKPKRKKAETAAADDAAVETASGD